MAKAIRGIYEGGVVKPLEQKGENRVWRLLATVEQLSSPEREQFIYGLRDIPNLWEEVEDIIEILHQKKAPRRSYRQARKELGLL